MIDELTVLVSKNYLDTQFTISENHNIPSTGYLGMLFEIGCWTQYNSESGGYDAAWTAGMATLEACRAYCRAHGVKYFQWSDGARGVDNHYCWCKSQLITNGNHWQNMHIGEAICGVGETMPCFILFHLVLELEFFFQIKCA